MSASSGTMHLDAMDDPNRACPSSFMAENRESADDTFQRRLCVKPSDVISFQPNQDGVHDGDTLPCSVGSAPLASPPSGRQEPATAASKIVASANVRRDSLLAQVEEEDNYGDDEDPYKDLSRVPKPSRRGSTPPNAAARRTSNDKAMDAGRAGTNDVPPCASLGSSSHSGDGGVHTTAVEAATADSTATAAKTNTITSASSRTNSTSISAGDLGAAIHFGFGGGVTMATPTAASGRQEDGRVSYGLPTTPSLLSAAAASGTPTGPRRSSAYATSRAPVLCPATTTTASPSQKKPPLHHSRRRAGATTPLPPSPAAPRWHKVLYERQPFEDNYVDPEQFLNDLRENENVRGYHYLDVVYNTLVIVQQIALVALFTCAFGKVLTDDDDSYTLVYLDGGILLTAWVMYVQFRKQSRKHVDENDLLLFHSDYGRSVRDARSGSSAPAMPSQNGNGVGSGGNGSSRLPSQQNQQQQSHLITDAQLRGRSPMLRTPSCASISSPEEVPDNAHVPPPSLYTSTRSTHLGTGWTGNPLGRSPMAVSPLLGSRAANWSSGSAHGSNGGVAASAGNSASSASATPTATTAGTSTSGGAASRASGRGIVVVKDGGEQTHSDVPLIVGYVNEFGRKVISLGTFIILLTPILSTLTVTYSTDTIIALSILAMVLHVLLADYSYLNGYTDRYAPNFSVNSAIFGVILMASRIPSPMRSGSLIAFGAFCFSLSPIARHMVKQHSKNAHIAITALLFVLAAFFLSAIPVLCFLFIMSMVMVAFVIPWWFVSLHSSVKAQINGPWDEAKPTNNAAAAEWANAGLLS